ncbi:MAG: histidine phosphatase family protein [Erysipelotrichaceae bacterium]|nr:histidine phosphatase family protein [Erysipelotrichaceae bacterium]
MTDIYLLRHAETDAGKGLCIGRRETRLSEKGKKRTAALAGWLKENLPDVTAVYTSPLQRAETTAGIIAQAYGLTPAYDEDLPEIDTGVWDGLSFAEIKEQYPEEYEKRGADPWHYRIENGETFEEVARRVNDAVLRIAAGEKTALIVTHKGAINALRIHLHQAEENEILNLACANLSILSLRIRDGILSAVSEPYRPQVLLDDEMIRELWRKHQTPEHVIRHMDAVAAYALQIIAGTKGIFHAERICKAALLHDLDRLQPHHAAVCAESLRKEGFWEIAAMIAVHHREEYDPYANLTDADILWYADKCVLEDRIVGIEERFAASRKKCKSEEALIHHQRRYEKAVWIRHKLEEEKQR